MSGPESPSPYAAPGAPLENHEPARGQILTAAALRYLLNSAKWMRSSVMALGAILALQAVDQIILLHTIGTRSIPLMVLAILFAAATLGAAIYLVPQLLRSIRLIRSARDGTSESFFHAMEAHRVFWRRVAIACMVIVGLAIAAYLSLPAAVTYPA